VDNPPVLSSTQWQLAADTAAAAPSAVPSTAVWSRTAAAQLQQSLPVPVRQDHSPQQAHAAV